MLLNLREQSINLLSSGIVGYYIKKNNFTYFQSMRSLKSEMIKLKLQRNSIVAKVVI